MGKNQVARTSSTRSEFFSYVAVRLDDINPPYPTAISNSFAFNSTVEKKLM